MITSQCHVALLNGASASGKSRLIAGIQRIASQAGVLRDVRIPKRTTTRPPRENESLSTENRYLSASEFEQKVQTGELDVQWRRPISSTLEHRYGFRLAPELKTPGVLILSANNYLDWRAQPLLQALRRQDRLMVVRIFASEETRLDRLQARRPPLSRTELLSRMADVPAHELPPADFAVPNDHAFQELAEWEFLRLLSSFAFSGAALDGPLQLPDLSVPAVGVLR
jgi:guanylate kinase